MPVPLDEYPIHQTPLSLAYVGTTDRNFYDRCYFNAHPRGDELFLVTGLGVYPNLGVIDAYATVRKGGRQFAVRFSGALGDERLDQRVGPYRIEVQEPLRRVRLVCDGDEFGLGFDLTWTGSFPAVQEPAHQIRFGARTILDTSRFAQVGTWDGVLRVDGAEHPVTGWVGTRDRSWGIRPVGEPDPAGRPATEPMQGFWWTYVPLRFEDFAVVIIAQENPDGFRTLNDAVRVWPDGRVEQLGWPRFDIGYRSGTRYPERATIHLTTVDGTPLAIGVETLTSVALNVGCGYGGDPDWAHGQWKGEHFAEGATYDLADPAVAGRLPFGVIDHVARATCDGAEGWGLFEHASFGRHAPTGFADWSAVAP
ncbi:MAG TPA: hypothetical protein VJT31_20250 [Rugosimonospora sp.]|nr:hypothetical protein [Rugosimonospora sp.]